MKPEKNALEWAVFAISVALLIGVVAVLINGVRSSVITPADLKVTAESPARTPNGYVVPLLVKNDGGETAESARIEATLRRDGKEVERSEVSLQFVPPRSIRKAAVVFQNDPQGSALALRVTGFERP